MPRWRRPSVKAARTGATVNPVDPRSRPARVFPNPPGEYQRFVIRYDVVALLSEPDEVLGVVIGELDFGDEVEAVARGTAWLQVRTPSGPRLAAADDRRPVRRVGGPPHGRRPAPRRERGRGEPGAPAAEQPTRDVAPGDRRRTGADGRPRSGGAAGGRRDPDDPTIAMAAVDIDADVPPETDGSARHRGRGTAGPTRASRGAAPRHPGPTDPGPAAGLRPPVARSIDPGGNRESWPGAWIAAPIGSSSSTAGRA